MLDILKQAGVIPVIRASSAARARSLAGVLQEAGFEVFEITMTTPDATRVIAELRSREGITVGAGTVLSADQAKMAQDAGASFLVSPAFLPEVVERGLMAGSFTVPGAATPTEVLQAHRAGAELVKVFPAASLGGPAYLKGLRAVYPDIPLMPTGGINLANLADYLKSGAACVGMGGALCDDAALEQDGIEGLRETARAVRAAVDSFNQP